LSFILLFYNQKTKDMEPSRKLPIDDYLEVLQLEYLSNKLRGLIYEEPIFIKVKTDIALKKRDKIKKLAKKMAYFCIFDSPKFFDSFLERKFLNEFGLPNLQYGIDKEKSRRAAWWDKFYLFKPGTIVEYEGRDCKVLENDPDLELLYLETGLSDEKNPYIPYSYVKIKNLSSLLHQDLKE
jgi:hypothetical protein